MFQCYLVYFSINHTKLLYYYSSNLLSWVCLQCFPIKFTQHSFFHLDVNNVLNYVIQLYFYEQKTISGIFLILVDVVFLILRYIFKICNFAIWHVYFIPYAFVLCEFFKDQHPECFFHSLIWAKGRFVFEYLVHHYLKQHLCVQSSPCCKTLNYPILDSCKIIGRV